MQPSPPGLQSLCTSSVPLQGQISVALLHLLATSTKRNCWWAGKTLAEYLLWLPRLGNRFIVFLSSVSSQFTFNSRRSPPYPHWPYELDQENEIMILSLKEPVCIKQHSKASQTAPLQRCYPKMRTQGSIAPVFCFCGLGEPFHLWTALTGLDEWEDATTL